MQNSLTCSAVVRKDSEAFHQWTTYWLILHIYLLVLSPILHLTLHPIFQILAILWLSLPQYQGASVIFDRIVNPWVDQYESKVDGAVEEAHRGVRRWFMSRIGMFAWLLIGEGGSLAQGIFNVAMGLLGVEMPSLLQSKRAEDEDKNNTIQPSTSTESISSQTNPQHSVRGALQQSSSMEEVDGIRDKKSFDPSNEFVQDFISMLQQGLYVFANVSMGNDGVAAHSDANNARSAPRHSFEGGFKLGVFSFTEDCSAFLISPVAAGASDVDVRGSATPVRMSLEQLEPIRVSGSQGLILECSGSSLGNARVEIVLSDENDRNILFNGLVACLPCCEG